MAKLLKLRRGTTTQHNTFTGAEGEVTVDTTKDTLVVHDGATAGGFALLRQDVNNLGTGAITSTHIADGTIVDGDINASAAIAHTKLASIAAGSVLMGNASAVPTATVLTGDVTITPAGVTAISAGVVSATDIADGAITSAKIADGAIVDGDINASAAIADTKLATISTAGKVSNSATTATNNNTASAIVARDASGNFSAGTITASLSGNATTATTATNAQGLTGTPNITVGTVTASAFNCNGTATIAASQGLLIIKDSDSTGVNSTNVLVGADSAGTEKWKFGDDQTGSEWLYIRNFSTSNGIAFAVGGTDRAYINGNGHLMPAANNSYDLGESGNRWRNIYTNDMNLSNEGGANDVDGTWGSWTIQEGEDDLFLLNRRNGKKYKFTLQEV